MQAAAVPLSPDETLVVRRHELSVMECELAVRRVVEQRVVDRPGPFGLDLVHAGDGPFHRHRVRCRRARASLVHAVGMAESWGSRGDARATTHAQRLKSRDGYFAPESVIRRLGNTPLVPFLGGGPAVLLQVAHPLVAAGVLEHSDVRRDLWRRLVHTLRALYLIAYGTKEEAQRAAELVQAVHTRVHGSTRTQLGRFPPGTPYSASDPELMLWVHATLVQASLAAYDRFVDPLSREDQERYYQEMALVARLFGTPVCVIPRSLADFREYFAAQISGETIAVTAPAREVAAA